MTGAPNTEAPTRMEIGLVLQGGGALGADESGAITALFDLIDEAIGGGQDITLRVVTGVSIGAINAACVVGATDRADARNRLSAMWGDFMIELPYLPPSANRDLALYKVPHFYTYRSDLLAAPTWTYLYDTHQLLQTLSDHVDFGVLNANKTTAFVITAVDVESGVLTRFTNQKVGHTEQSRSSHTTSWQAAAFRRNFPGPTSALATAKCSIIGRRHRRQHAAGRRHRRLQLRSRRYAAAGGHEPVPADRVYPPLADRSERAARSASLRQSIAPGQQHRRADECAERPSRGSPAPSWSDRPTLARGPQGQRLQACEIDRGLAERGPLRGFRRSQQLSRFFARGHCKAPRCRPSDRSFRPARKFRQPTHRLTKSIDAVNTSAS